MPANLKDPFGESCCDGGICDITAQSAQSCGCGPGLKPTPWVCQMHQAEARINKAQLEAQYDALKGERE